MKKILCMILLLGAILVGCADTEPKKNVVPESTAQNNVPEGVTETPEQQSNSAQSQDQVQENEPYIVNFEANTIDGQTFSSERFSESKITMINVWATYCNPCLAEMPDLGDIADSYDRPDFQLIGIISDVMEDSPQSDIDNAKNLIMQTEAEYPHLLLNQSLFDSLVGGVSSVPTTFFVNSEGELITYVVGANDEDTWERIIDELLAKEGVIDD